MIQAVQCAASCAAVLFNVRLNDDGNIIWVLLVVFFKVNLQTTFFDITVTYTFTNLISSKRKVLRKAMKKTNFPTCQLNLNAKPHLEVEFKLFWSPNNLIQLSWTKNIINSWNPHSFSSDRHWDVHATLSESPAGQTVAFKWALERTGTRKWAHTPLRINTASVSKKFASLCRQQSRSGICRWVIRLGREMNGCSLSLLKKMQTGASL